MNQTEEDPPEKTKTLSDYSPSSMVIVLIETFYRTPYKHAIEGQKIQALPKLFPNC